MFVARFTLGILPYLAAFICAELAYAAEISERDAIPAVKSWKELRSRPAIDLGNGVKIRLGLEAVRASRFSGVMLYCLTEGFNQNNADLDLDPDDQLGPVQFKITKRKELDELKSVKSRMERLKRLERAGARLLFAQVIPIDSECIYDVTVLNAKGKKLASGVIHGTAGATHAWSPFEKSGKALDKLSAGNDVPEAHLKYDGHGIALPKVSGQEPIQWEESNGQRGPHSFGDNDPLPSLSFGHGAEVVPPSPELQAKVDALVAKLGDDDFQTRESVTRELIALGNPAQPAIVAAAKTSTDIEVRARLQPILNAGKSSFTLSLSGTALLLNSKPGFEVTLVEDHFLARWWVNDTPYTPPSPEAREVHDGGGLVRESEGPSNSLLLKVDLNAAKLGAKKGDRIGVQLMYCPNGWKKIGPMEEMARLMTDRPDIFPTLSNRIDFRAP